MYVMWQRQMKRFLRSKSRIIGSLAQPLLFLLSFGFGFGAVFSKAGEGNYIEFLGPGIVGMSILFTAMFSGMEVIWDRQFGFLKETLVAPVSRITIMIGRVLGSATVATLQGCIVLAITLVAGFHPYSWALVPVAILVMALIATLFTALGTIVGSTLRDMQGFQFIMGFLVMPLFFLSGALFPLSGIPPVMELIARFDPLSYGIDLMRWVLIGTAHFSVALDLGVLVTVTVIFLAVGSYFFSKIEA